MRAWCFFKNKLSFCSIPVFKYLNFQEIKPFLVSEPLYKCIILEGFMYFQECCALGIRIHGVRSSEKVVKAQLSASHALFNQEKMIFSLCR